MGAGTGTGGDLGVSKVRVNDPDSVFHGKVGTVIGRNQAKTHLRVMIDGFNHKGPFGNYVPFKLENLEVVKR